MKLSSVLMLSVALALAATAAWAQDGTRQSIAAPAAAAKVAHEEKLQILEPGYRNLHAYKYRAYNKAQQVHAGRRHHAKGAFCQKAHRFAPTAQPQAGTCGAGTCCQTRTTGDMACPAQHHPTCR